MSAEVPEREAERRAALHCYDVLDTPPEECFDRITRLAADVFDVPIALISLVDAERQWFKSCHGLDRRATSREHFFCTHAIRSEHVMVVEDATDDPRFVDNPLVTGDPHVRFYAGAPLITPGGYKLGTLCLLDTTPGTLDEREQAQLQDLAAMAMSELELRRENTERRKKNEAYRERLHLEETVARVSSLLLSSTPDLDAVLAMLGAALHASRVYLFELYDDGQKIDNTHEWMARGVPSRITSKQDLTPQDFPWWFAHLQNEGMVRSRVSDLPPEATAERDFLRQRGITSLLDVAIRFRDGTLYGHLGFDDTDTDRRLTDEDAHLLRLASDLLADHFERERATRALRAAQQETEALLESIGSAFFSFDADWIFTYANDEAEQLFGHPREELLGRNLWEVFPEAVDTAFYEQYHRARREQTDVRFETWYPARERWLEVHAYPRAQEGLSVLISDITERKKAEADLRESEQKFREIAETITEAFWMWSPASETPLYVSPAYEEIWGRPRAELYENGFRDTWLQAVHPDDRERLRAAVRSLPPEGYDVTFRIQRSDGSVRWIHDRAFAVKDEDERAPQRVVGVARDITERKETEEALRRSEARFRTLIERTPQLITIMKDDGTVRYTSPTTEHLLGYTPAELEGEDPFERMHPDDRAPMRDVLAAVFQTPGATRNVHFRTRHADGSWVHVDSLVRNLADDPAIGGVVVISRDVTERVRAEEALQRSEQRHRRLIERASDIMTVMEADGTVRYQSPSFRQVLNRSPKAIVGESAFDGIHREDVDRVRTTFDKSLNHPNEAFTVQYRARHADGRWVHLESAMRNLMEDPVIHGIVANTRDISDSLRFEAEREARRRAEELLEAKTSFLNNISHELRTPLAAILGFADILAEEGEGVQHEFAQRIARSGRRLQETLDSVLNLAQIESGTVTADLQPVDVAEKVQETITLLQPLAEEKNIALTASAPSEGAAAPQALLDPQALHRILNNLIGNAIKFTEEGGVTVSVEAGVESDAQTVQLHVRDTGIGIGEAFLPHLFDDFKQESTGLQRSHEGSGLGLTITRRLIELMNGTIAVESTPGEGSCFTVSFPQAAPTEAPGARTGGEPREGLGDTPAQVPGAAPALLVVEDNPNTRALARHILKDGYQIAVASNAAEARALADGRTFDLLLLDINLGEGPDGRALLHTLRAQPTHAQTPALAVTAHAMPGDEEQLREAGFDGYLSKPFRKKELLAAVEDALTVKEEKAA